MYSIRVRVGRPLMPPLISYAAEPLPICMQPAISICAHDRAGLKTSSSSLLGSALSSGNRPSMNSLRNTAAIALPPARPPARLRCTECQLVTNSKAPTGLVDLPVLQRSAFVLLMYSLYSGSILNRQIRSCSLSPAMLRSFQSLSLPPPHGINASTSKYTKSVRTYSEQNTPEKMSATVTTIAPVRVAVSITTLGLYFEVA